MKSAHTGQASPFISLRNASFRLGECLVFANTSWVLRRDEHWAIVGPNGGGKSILADCLRSRLPTAGGELRYHFRPPTGLLQEQLIGYVSFEERKLDLGEAVVQSRWNSIEEEEAATVGEMLSYERVMDINPFAVTEPGERARRAAFERRKRRAINLLHIGGFLERSFISLSNGESQRVELAKALCHPLRLLILDEPYTGLDTAMRSHVSAILDHLMRTSVRVVIVTTRTEDLPLAVDRVAYVNNCALLAAGNREAVLSRRDVRRVIRARSRIRLQRSHAKGPRRSVTNVLVELKDVTVRYGKATVLDRVSWVIRAGESWALLGPNGSGKTTLLSLTLGDNPQAYSNVVRVFGKQRGMGDSIWEFKQQIGWVSPELQLNFDGDMSCFEVVASGFHKTLGLFEPLTARQRKATCKCIEQFRLTAHANTPMAALSPGLQRSVLLARAVVDRPRLLVLDEPCQGLDVGHRAEVIACVEDLLRLGRVTVLYSTHRLDEIPPSITRVLRLDSGRVIETGFSPGNQTACKG